MHLYINFAVLIIVFRKSGMKYNEGKQPILLTCNIQITKFKVTCIHQNLLLQET